MYVRAGVLLGGPGIQRFILYGKGKKKLEGISQLPFFLRKEKGYGLKSLLLSSPKRGVAAWREEIFW